MGLASIAAATRHVFAAVAAIASVVAMGWLVQSGGFTGPRSAAASAPTPTASMEECNFALRSTPVATDELAPAIASSFLLKYGYSVSVEKSAAQTRVLGRRADRTCAFTITTMSGDSDGFRALANESATVVLATREMTARELAALAPRGATADAAARTDAERVVAFDALAVAVNAANPIEQMDFFEARASAQGEKQSWSDVGGPDLPVLPIAQTGGMSFDATAARGRTYATEREILYAIEAERGAVGIVSASLVRQSPGVKALAISFGGAASPPSPENVRELKYLLVRPLLAYARPDDARMNPLVRSFMQYLQSEEGLAAVDRAGFVAARPNSPFRSAAASFASRCTLGSSEFLSLAVRLKDAERLDTVFKFNSNAATLSDETTTEVTQVAPSLRERIARGSQIVLVGHSDDVGDASTNRTLALERANVARAALERAGVFGVEVESAGEMCPATDNRTTDGRSANRRVEMWVRQG